MIIDVVFLQHTAPIVVEIYPDLLSTVDAIMTQHRLTASGDPDTSKSIGVDLIALNQPKTIVMLRVETHTCTHGQRQSFTSCLSHTQIIVLMHEQTNR